MDRNIVWKIGTAVAVTEVVLFVFLVFSGHLSWKVSPRSPLSSQRVNTAASDERKQPVPHYLYICYESPDDCMALTSAQPPSPGFKLGGPVNTWFGSIDGIPKSIHAGTFREREDEGFLLDDDLEPEFREDGRPVWNDIKIFKTPGKTGPLSIVGVGDEELLVRGKNNSTFIFDIRTGMLATTTCTWGM